MTRAEAKSLVRPRRGMYNESILERELTEMRCPSCGHESRNNTDVCAICGARLPRKKKFPSWVLPMAIGSITTAIVMLLLLWPRGGEPATGQPASPTASEAVFAEAPAETERPAVTETPTETEKPSALTPLTPLEPVEPAKPISPEIPVGPLPDEKHWEGNWCWTLQDGVLNISGSGRMKDYEDYKDVPWFSANDQIREIVVEDQITRIGDHAFFSCNASKVHIGSGVKEIGSLAFAGCDYLEEIRLPEGVTSIGVGAFQHSQKLRSLNIPASVTKIEHPAFCGCVALEEFQVARDNPCFAAVDGVLFSRDRSELICYPINKAGDTYHVPGNVKTIKIDAFAYCNLREVFLPDSVTSIEFVAFAPCHSLENVRLSNSLPELDSSVFSGCDKLAEIRIPDSVKKIDSGCFSNCKGLKRVFLPAGIQEIGESVFEHCEALTDVYFAGTRDAWEKIVVLGANEPLLNARLHPNSR